LCNIGLLYTTGVANEWEKTGRNGGQKEREAYGSKDLMWSRHVLVVDTEAFNLLVF